MIRTTPDSSPTSFPFGLPTQSNSSDDTAAVMMEGFQTARRQAEDLISKHPAVAVAAAVAAGVALGCLIKRT